MRRSRWVWTSFGGRERRRALPACCVAGGTWSGGVGSEQRSRYAGRGVDSVVDASTFPLIGITVEPQPTLETFEEIFKKVEEVLAQHTSLCVMINAEQTTRIDLAQVRRIAEFGETHDKLLAAYIRALVFIIPSAMVRGALRVAFQIKAPPHPVHICQTEAEARAYLDPYLAVLV